jgi:hypothetical protein
MADAREVLTERYKNLAKVAKLAVKTYDPGAFSQDGSAQVVKGAIKLERQMFNVLHAAPGHIVSEQILNRQERVWVGADTEYDVLTTRLFCETCRVASVAWPHLVLGAYY